MAEPLIAEDLLLLLLDDERGTPPMLWVDTGVPLTAAVLAQLALDGAVDVEPGSTWRSARLTATGAPEPDPLLEHALSIVAEKPRTPSALSSRIGKGLQDGLAARLAERGVLQRRDERVLGLVPRTTWPASSTERERAVRARLRTVLLDDADPDEREAVLVGILSALDRIPQTLGLHGGEASAAKRRAKAIAKGDWASKAVSDAVTTMVAAVMTPAVTAAVIAGS